MRGLVSAQDLERFDALVLRREIEALKARQGAAGGTALHTDSFSMVSYPDTLASSSGSYVTSTTLSSARVSGTVCVCVCWILKCGLFIATTVRVYNGVYLSVSAGQTLMMGIKIDSE